MGLGTLRVYTVVTPMLGMFSVSLSRYVNKKWKYHLKSEVKKGHTMVMAHTCKNRRELCPKIGPWSTFSEV